MKEVFQVGGLEDGRSEGRLSRLEAWNMECLKEDFSGWRLGRCKVRRKIFQVGGLEDGRWKVQRKIFRFDAWKMEGTKEDAWKVQVET